jgi:hypothetical protein
LLLSEEPRKGRESLQEERGGMRPAQLGGDYGWGPETQKREVLEA